MSAAFALALALAGAAAAVAEDAPICTDRPAKANATCTVADDRFQLETSVVAWGRAGAGPSRTNLLAVGSSVLKYGLTDRSDVQLGFTPLVSIVARQDGPRERRSGIGDLMVRYKHRLTAEGAPLQLAIIPFAKLPTARRGIGNGRLEGGIAVPVSVPVGKAVLTVGPELDLLADGDGRGRHVAFVNLVNLSAPLAPRLTLAAELWSNVNFDPGGRISQASADLAAAYALSPDLQWDVGLNAGLTRDTPDVEVYTGLSIRF